jgi:hypothetical protein
MMQGYESALPILLQKFPFHVIDLVDALLMPSTRKPCFKPNTDNLFTHFGANNLASQREYICIVVFTGIPGNELIMATSRFHSRY